MISPSFFQDSTCMQLAHCLVPIEAVVEGDAFHNPLYSTCVFFEEL